MSGTCDFKFSTALYLYQETRRDACMEVHYTHSKLHSHIWYLCHRVSYLARKYFVYFLGLISFLKQCKNKIRRIAFTFRSCQMQVQTCRGQLS